MARLCAAVLGIVLAVTLSELGHADTVYVRSGQQEGQGWAFIDRTGCWAVTAKHVISAVGAIVIGAQGARAQADFTVFSSKLDLALLRLQGACPGSMIGDRDVSPLLERIQHQGLPIVLEHRAGSTTEAIGVSYGLETVVMELLGVSDQEPTFTLRPARGARDAIVQTDSGSPIRFQGTGIGEAGLPLGLATDVENGVVTAIRIDAARAFFEATVMSPSTTVPPKPATVELVKFEGDTPDTACGPLNLFSSGKPCGWKAIRSMRGKPLELVIGLVDPAANISGIEMKYVRDPALKGIAASTSGDPRGASDWLGERYCPAAAETDQIACSLGQRSARSIRVVIDSPALHILEVHVLMAR